MPRKAIDYSKSIIYKIVCNDINITDCYVGSTTDLKSRKCHHKSTCNNSNDKEYNIYKYQFIRENGGWMNWSVIVVEELKCESKNQLETRERYWLEQLGATLNTYIPTRTKKESDKEYRENNKDKMKQHYWNNKQTINEKRKMKVKCEVCKCEVRKSDITKHNESKKHKNNS
jgi:hypothetical protein